ncbi:MAG: hypothetical protein IT350_10115 [Deltaproteobacteria bacterium]|nr:hypothetical protein [Deltaproteobacteria bacterium]
MANIGVAQIISSAPLIDRVQSVHQGQGGTANPQVAEALIKKNARANEQVKPPPTAERVTIRDERPKREGKDKGDGEDDEDDDTNEAPRKRIDITA